MKNELWEQVLDRKARFWTADMEVEWDAIEQIRKIASLPVIAGRIAIMPDVHLGKGATVGSVIPTRSAVIPSAVGVDIACGMIAVRTNLKASDLPDNLNEIRAQIERDVPVGFSFHTSPKNIKGMGLAGAKLDTRRADLLNQFEDLAVMDRVGDFNMARMAGQIGTLGGGNHFIELCLDEAQDVWVMLHSGSRNVGKTIGEVAMEMAWEYASRQGFALPDRNLGWLADGTREFSEYVQALSWAQVYAAINREVMLLLVMEALRKALPGKDVRSRQEAVNCHHNYLSMEVHNGQDLWITRKGAVSARHGEIGIIPGSMGAKSYIVRGKGNAESYCSCSHGAGRRMSRGAAKRMFSLADLEAQTAGVECRKDGGVLDEIPAAYKDIDAVMAAQSDLVEIQHTLKQVLCIKG